MDAIGGYFNELARESARNNPYELSELKKSSIASRRRYGRKSTPTGFMATTLPTTPAGLWQRYTGPLDSTETYTEPIDVAYGGDWLTDKGDLQQAIANNHVSFVRNIVGEVTFQDNLFQLHMNVPDVNPGKVKSWWVRTAARPAFPGHWVLFNIVNAPPLVFNTPTDIAYGGNFAEDAGHILQATWNGTVLFVYNKVGTFDFDSPETIDPAFTVDPNPGFSKNLWYRVSANA